jgi:predicted CoA-binding protein
MGEVVAIVGASTDRRKFGNKAVRAFARRGFDVKPIHPSAARVEGLPAFRSVADVPGPIDRVTLYVPPEIGLTLLDAIAAVKPGELWINPGAESPALLARARALGLDPILACSLIAIGEIPDGGD